MKGDVAASSDPTLSPVLSNVMWFSLRSNRRISVADLRWSLLALPLLAGCGGGGEPQPAANPFSFVGYRDGATLFRGTEGGSATGTVSSDGKFHILSSYPGHTDALDGRVDRSGTVETATAQSGDSNGAPLQFSGRGTITKLGPQTTFDMGFWDQSQTLIGTPDRTYLIRLYDAPLGNAYAYAGMRSGTVTTFSGYDFDLPAGTPITGTVAGNGEFRFTATGPNKVVVIVSGTVDRPGADGTSFIFLINVTVTKAGQTSTIPGGVGKIRFDGQSLEGRRLTISQGDGTFEWTIGGPDPSPLQALR